MPRSKFAGFWTVKEKPALFLKHFGRVKLMGLDITQSALKILVDILVKFLYNTTYRQ